MSLRKQPEHKIAIEVKFLGATNTRGSGICLRLPRWKKSSLIGYRHECNSALDGAIAYLLENKIRPDTLLDLDSHYVLGVPWKQLDIVLATFNVPKH